MKELKFNIRYIFQKREFYLAVLAVSIISLPHTVILINTLAQQNTYIETTYSAEYQSILYNPLIPFNIAIIIMFPIICSTLFGDSDWFENNKSTYNILSKRLNIKKNIVIRFILSFVFAFIISFFAFILNYLILRTIFLNGNILTYFQSLSISLVSVPEYFLDSIRINNPTLFIILLSLFESIYMGLISCFTYSISFFIKQRVAIFFVPIIFIIISELICSIIDLNYSSFIDLMQCFSKYNMGDVISASVTILFFSIINLFIILRKKDIIV